MAEIFVLRAGFLSGPGFLARAAIGKAGITRHKREGDFATPAGLLRLTRVLYRAGSVKTPACAVPVEPIAPDDAWCDDAAHAAYNQKIRLPFDASHERLHRADEIYDVIGVLDWNTTPIIAGNGSAIFLHCARPDYTPTEGCIALALPDLLAALKLGLAGIVVEA